jgi:hypothetical protein
VSRPWSARVAAAALALALAWLPAGPAPAGEPPAPAAAAPAPEVKVLPRRVVAYYFHGNVRCATCRKLEAYSKEAVETAFAAELKDGRVVWQAVNFDDKQNQHYLKDYKLYTKSLVIVDEANGKAKRWKNLEKIWQLVGDKPAFLRYVQGELRAYLPAGA